MKAHKSKENSLVDQYIKASCFNEISDSTYQNMLNYEKKADSIEKKLIRRIKQQVRDGKVVLFSQSKEKT